MPNDTPRKDSDLLTTCQDLVTGEESIGNDIGVAQNKAPKITLDINDLIAKRDTYESAKATLVTRREAVRLIVVDGKGYMTLAREVLKPRLGAEFTDSWKLVGFEDSLAMPATPAAMQLALKAAQKYFETNPTFEVAALNVTALEAKTIHDSLSTARGALYNQEMVVGAAKEERDKSVEKLRRRYRGFIDEVSQLIEPLDQRWKVFGLTLPGALPTPEVPTNVSAILIGPNAASMKWGQAARAEYYRIWMKVHGAQTEYTAVGSPADLDFTIENLPANSQIDVAVSAVNNGGESQLSEPVTITTQA